MHESCPVTKAKPESGYAANQVLGRPCFWSLGEGTLIRLQERSLRLALGVSRV